MLRKSLRAIRTAAVCYFVLETVITLWQYILTPIFAGTSVPGTLAVNVASAAASLLMVLCYIAAGRGKKTAGMRIAAFVLQTGAALYVWIPKVPEYLSGSTAALLLNCVASIALYILLYLWLPVLIAAAAPEAGGQADRYAAPDDGRNAGAAAPDSGYYVGPIRCILLFIFTLGIWPLIWMYRTTARLNEAPAGRRYSPGKQLLACIFIPFYQVYWYYKQAQKMDSLLRAHGLPGSVALPCLLTAMLPCVPLLVMQDKFNELALAEAGAPSEADGAYGRYGYGESPRQAPAAPVPDGYDVPFRNGFEGLAPENDTASVRDGFGFQSPEGYDTPFGDAYGDPAQDDHGALPQEGGDAPARDGYGGQSQEDYVGYDGADRYEEAADPQGDDDPVPADPSPQFYDDPAPMEDIPIFADDVQLFSEDGSEQPEEEITVEELNKYRQLFEIGMITWEEYAAMKKRLAV